MDISIYHNPRCGTSRNTLALIRNTGVEPQVVDYIANPPTRAALADMIARAGLTVREAMRSKEPVFAELGLGDPALDDGALLDAMVAHPILINRPFVVTPAGVRLCRPSELVLDILTMPQLAAFTKEDGEAVIGADGKRIAQK
jgi:arsenate reductase (glutaredoxin)